MRCESGFSLIELITVIVITGIIAFLAAQNIVRPVEGFLDLSTRAALVDAAELALQRMSREIRLALPNSVRLRDGTTPGLQGCSASGGGICAVEILRTLEGGRYRREGDGVNTDECGAEDDRLDFSAASDCFEVLGPLTNLPEDGDTAGVNPATQTACMQGLVDCLVIFNTGQAGADAWAGDNIAGIQSATATRISFHIAPAARFPFESPRQRFHIVDTPVSFVCDTATGTLTRYAEYAMSATQPIAPGGNSALLAGNVASCSFSYVQGTGSRNALLTVTLVLRATDTQGAANEVRLVEQISVPNIP